MMGGRGCIFVMFSLLTLASILENSQTFALYALPTHWMGQPKFRFYSPIMATPEPSTQPAPKQKGTFIDKRAKRMRRPLYFRSISLLHKALLRTY